MSDITAKRVLLKNSNNEYLIPYTGETGSNTAGLPPSNCKNLNVNKNGNNYELTWSDPKDTIINDLTLCTWAGTVIVRKSGAYPENITDGDIVVDSKVRTAIALMLILLIVQPIIIIGLFHIQ